MDHGKVIKRLREIMWQKGISIKDLSKRSGIGEVTLYRRFEGESLFRAGEIWKVSEVLGIEDIESIFF